MDRARRAGWTLAAVALLAVTAAGLLAGLGLLGRGAADTPLLPEAVVRGWRRWWPGAPLALAAAGLLLAAAGTRLLWAGLRPARPVPLDDLELAGPPTGWTLVKAAAITGGVEADLRGVPGVERAAVGLFGSPHRPVLRAELDLRPDASPARVRRHVQGCLDRLAATTGIPPHPVEVTLRLLDGDPAGPR